MNTQKLKTNWLKTMAAAFAALMATGAHGAEKITVDEVANHYPWDGKVDCVTTLSGLDTTRVYKYEGAFTLSVKKDGTKVSKAITNDFASADGTYTNTFDCAALFGAGLYPNGGIAVDLVKNLGGVQLWADGPYWAECNVGATKTEEYGYYFMWGDTNAYVRNSNNDGWVSVKDGTTLSGGFTSSNCATYRKTNTKLSEAGYIDSTTGYLVAAHDAATTHLGDPWRMPTDAEMQALITNCTTEWTTTNGVLGRLVTGKGDYATKSIFLPAAGYGTGTGFYYPGEFGYYWSATPQSDMIGISAYFLAVSSGDPQVNFYTRYFGMSVRPVRTIAK